MHVESLLLDLLIYLGNKYDSIELKEIGFFSIINAHVTKNEAQDRLKYHPARFEYVSNPVSSINIISAARKERLLNEDALSALSGYLSEKASKLKLVGQVDLPGIGHVRRLGDEIIVENENNLDHHQNYFPSLDVPDRSIERLVEKQITSEEGVISSMKGQRIDIEADNDIWSRFIGPFALLTIGIASMILFMKHCTTNQSASLEKEEQFPVHTITPEHTKDKDGVDLAGGIFNNRNLNKYKHILTQAIIDDGCKITVGSFKRATNAQIMMTELKERGYPASVVDYEDGTRVIITFDCAAYDLEAYLYRIREEVSPSAWYLQPDWDPEDETE